MKKTVRQLQTENEELKLKFSEAEETLQAIRNGEVDAIVVSNDTGEKIFTLTSAETPYRFIVEEMNEGAVILSSEGLILYCNHRFSEIISRPVETIIGSAFTHYFGPHETDEIEELMLAARNEKFAKELKLETNNQEIYLHLSFGPLPRNVLGSVCVIAVNITQLKRNAEKINELNLTLEEKVKDRTAQFEAVNSELESFTYSVSHDLRAPLRALNSYAEILEADYGNSVCEDAKEIIGSIKNNAIKMNVLIDSLLSFSRLGQKKIEKKDIDMNELVKAVLEEIQRTRPNKAEIKVGVLPHLKADYHLMFQVVLNLVSNAVKYSSKKKNPVVEIFSEKINGEVVFVVRDNGAGFDMHFADKLFGVFQRLHSEKEFEGTGVGLAIVHRIISKHNGRVWATGKENEGASFYFTVLK